MNIIKLKLVLAAACGLALLLGVGIGLRNTLLSKPGKEAPKTKLVKAADKTKPSPAAKSLPKPSPAAAKPAPTIKPTAGKAKPAVTWQALESQFKPEGDARQQARQRIAFLEKLIGKFPGDRGNILAACLTIAAQAEILGDFCQAAEIYTRFLDQSPTNDSRRLGAAIPLIKNLAAAGDSRQAGKIFDRFYAGNPTATLDLAEKACAALARDRQNPACAGDFQKLAGLAAVFRSGLLRQMPEKPDQATRTALIAFARYERRGRAAVWMDEVKDQIPWDHADEATLLLGILGGMRSADCLVKAALGNERLMGEGVDVSGRFEDHSYIMASQYPCKADQLLAWFGKTGFEEYRQTAAGFIRKLHKLYLATKDVSGNNWPPIGRFVDAEGKAHTYFEAPKLDRNRDVFPWDQSKSRHNSHGDFMDAWGLGMWELSKSAGLLEAADRQLLVEVLKGMLDFQHRPYMLKDEGGVYYWRTDEFCPLNPTNIPAPDWRFLGRDVIHAVLALNEMKAWAPHDWNSGPGPQYYERTLTQPDLLLRPLMNGRPSQIKADIPKGKLYGVLVGGALAWVEVGLQDLKGPQHD